MTRQYNRTNFPLWEALYPDCIVYTKYDYWNKDIDNSRNGHSVKTVKTSAGEVEIAVPRDRKAEFKPQIIRKNETSLSWDIEEKIISMYAKGMTTNDISAHYKQTGKSHLYKKFSNFTINSLLAFSKNFPTKT